MHSPLFVISLLFFLIRGKFQTIQGENSFKITFHETVPLIFLSFPFLSFSLFPFPLFFLIYSFFNSNLFPLPSFFQIQQFKAENEADFSSWSQSLFLACILPENNFETYVPQENFYSEKMFSAKLKPHEFIESSNPLHSALTSS